jgi:cell division protein FtsW
MNLAVSIPRIRSRGDEEAPAAEPTAMVNRTPVKSRAGAVRRERHQADYVILVVVVALTALGILMVYSSSALKGYLSQDADTFATVGPQIQWALLGFVAMAVMMHVDYRLLRIASIPFYVFAVILLVLVFVPQLNIVIGGSARWLKLGPLPAIHPAEIAKLAMVIYLAHWFAGRGPKIRGFWLGTVPFLIIVGPIIALVFKEPDLGTTGVLTMTAFTMFFVAGANLFHLTAMFSSAAMAMIVVGLRGYQLDRIRVWQNPWLDPLGEGFHTVQGLLALAVGGILGTGLGTSKIFVPNAFNDFIFAEVGQEFGLIGSVAVIGLFLMLAYSGVRVALAAPDPFGALLAAGITAWLCLQAFLNIGVVVALLPITGITLPFISAGGSSLIISFAAVGILLSISRETVESATWNDDATADRGRRDGRTHLPGSRRRAIAPRAS